MIAFILALMVALTGLTHAVETTVQPAPTVSAQTATPRADTPRKAAPKAKAKAAPKAKPGTLGLDGKSHPDCIVIAETDDSDAYLECSDGYIEFEVTEDAAPYVDKAGKRHAACYTVRDLLRCSDGHIEPVTR